MSNKRQVNFLIGANADAFLAGMRTVQGQMKSLEKTTMQLGRTFSASLTAPIVAFGALSVRAFGQQEDAERKLAAALQATGQRVDENMARFKAFARELQSVTTVGDETTLALLQTATSFGLTGRSAERATRNAIAMQAAFGVGAQQAIRMTAALEQGDATMLRRYIPALRGVQDNVQAVGIAQRILSESFSVAEAEAQTFTGQVSQLRNQMGDFREQVGEVIAEGMMPLIKRTRELATDLQAMDSEVLRSRIGLGLMVASIGPALIGISKLTMAVRVLTATMLANPHMALATGIGVVLVGAWMKFRDEAAKSEARLRIINEAMQAQKQTVDELAGSMAELTREQQQQNLQEAISEQHRYIRALREERDAIKDVSEQISQHLPAQAGMIGAMSVQREVTNRNTEKLDEYNQKIADATTRLTHLGVALATANGRHDIEINVTPPARPTADLILSPDEIADIQFRTQQVSRYIDDILDGVELNLPDKMFPPGSIGFIEQRIQFLNNALRQTTDPAEIIAYTQRIAELNNQIGIMTGTVLDMPPATMFAMSVAQDFTNSFGQGMANVIVQGEKLQDTLRNIGRLLASSVIQRGLAVFLSGGLSGGGFFGSGGGLFGNLFGLNNLSLTPVGGSPSVGSAGVAGLARMSVDVNVTGQITASPDKLRVSLNDANTRNRRLG